MQKKLIALAVAAALTAPALALAESGNVTVYGKLIADIESVQTNSTAVANANPATVTGGTSYTVNRVVSNASRLGVKGEEDLGDGMKAFFQIESNVNLAGTDAAAGIFNGIRNSGAGIKSNEFGAVSLGNWDTPYKLTHNKIELFDNTTFASATNLIGRTTGVAGLKNVNAPLTAANFVTRQAGVVQYYSPKFSGFDVKAAFAPAADSFIANGVGKQNKAVFSVSGTFETEEIYAAFGYEAHNDAFAPTVNLAGNVTRGTGSDTATRLVGSYKIADGFWVGATLERISVTAAAAAAAAAGSTTATQQYARTGFELATSYKMDANNFGFSFVKLGNMGSAAASGAKQVSVRYGYDLSKRTQAFAMYSVLGNEANAQYGLSAGQAIPSTANAKLSGFGAGLQHSF